MRGETGALAIERDRDVDVFVCVDADDHLPLVLKWCDACYVRCPFRVMARASRPDGRTGL
jgi:hypothetical protein